MLHILSRNMRIKERPEKFQLERKKEFHLILTCEERVYDAVVEHFANVDSVSETPVHVINVDIIDNPGILLRDSISQVEGRFPNVLEGFVLWAKVVN